MPVPEGQDVPVVVLICSSLGASSIGLHVRPEMLSVVDIVVDSVHVRHVLVALEAVAAPVAVLVVVLAVLPDLAVAPVDALVAPAVQAAVSVLAEAHAAEALVEEAHVEAELVGSSKSSCKI